MSGTGDLAATLEAVAKGDEDAFRRLWDAASPQLYALCLRLMRRRHAADDALQESFVRIWQKTHLYDRRLGEPLGWMAAVTRNAALDQLRRERGRAETELEELAAVLGVPLGTAKSWVRRGLIELKGCLGP